MNRSISYPYPLANLEELLPGPLILLGQDCFLEKHIFIHLCSFNEIVTQLWKLGVTSLNSMYFLFKMI